MCLLCALVFGPLDRPYIQGSWGRGMIGVDALVNRLIVQFAKLLSNLLTIFYIKELYFRQGRCMLRRLRSGHIISLLVKAFTIRIGVEMLHSN